MLFIIEQIMLALSLIIPLLLVIAFFTLVERKVMASLQRRVGPNINGYFGLLQPLIDGFKLLMKEILVPARANFYIFLLTPMLLMSLSFSLWGILPLSFGFVFLDTKFSLLAFFILSSLNVYNIILAGWSSNSKYAFFGAIRSMAQMLSYELILGLLISIILLFTGSLRISDIVLKQYYSTYFLLALLPLAIIFFIVILIETNRAPFDLPEAESELVAGYNVEYSSITFAMFFLGEYCNILAMSTMWVILFWGGFSGTTQYTLIFFVLKIFFICFSFIFVRSMLPRYRFDQLLAIGWQALLPFLFGLLALYIGLLLLFNGFANFKATSLFSIIPSPYSVEANELTKNGLPDRQQKFKIFMHYYPHILDELDLFTYWERHGISNFEEIYNMRGLGGKTKTAYELLLQHTGSEYGTPDQVRERSDFFLEYMKHHPHPEIYANIK